MAFSENSGIEITSLAVMKRRCQNDFHCTFQKWLGSCRCSPYARASQKPGGQAECSTSDVRFSYTGAPVEKWTENNSDVHLKCAPSRRCFAAVESCHRFSCDFDFVVFNFSWPLSPTWAVAWSFGWCQEILYGILSLKGYTGFGCERRLRFLYGFACV